MTTVTKEQAQDRFAILPPTLQDAVFSLENPEIISIIGEQNHLSEEKTEAIATLVGWVLLGFLHIEDLPAEIVLATNIPLQGAKDIANALTSKIFAPIRPDLEKAYAPTLPAPKNDGPKIINDISTAIPAGPSVQSQPKPLATGTATSQTINSGPNVNSTAIPNNNIVPGAQKTNRLSDIGWSHSETATPVVKLDITQPSMGAPKPPAMPTGPLQQQPPSLTSTAPAGQTLGEFERLSAMKKGQAPVPAAPGATPAPFILHEDTTFTASTKNSDFKLSQPQANADMHLGSVKTPSLAKPAVLEFGGQADKPPVPTAPSKTAVHYTEFQSTLSKVPTQSSGARQVNQIMPTVPAAPVQQAPTASAIPVPRPPMPPSKPSIQSMPPVNQAPAQPQEKVIVKDFL